MKKLFADCVSGLSRFNGSLVSNFKLRKFTRSPLR